MAHMNASLSDHSRTTGSQPKIWSIITRLDQILAELDTLGMDLPAIHISLGTEFLRELSASQPKM